MGCENFLSGSFLKEELERSIEEANAAEVSIFIAPDANTGTVTPNGNVTYKVGKTIPIIFTEAKGYKFEYWEVIDRDTKEVIKDAISISDAYSHETELTVKSNASNIFIHPVCVERPSISNYAPQYADAGVPRDSSIVITFNKNISKDNDFSKILITSGGNSVRDCYKTPVVNSNILTFAANTANLIEASATKTISVTIPEDFYYMEGNSKVSLGTGFSWAFKVNNTTDSKTEISFSTDESIGKITPNGLNQKYNIGETINISFEAKNEYKFVGWKVENDASGVLSFRDKTSSSTTVTVLGSAKGLSITPDVIRLPRIEKIIPEYSNEGVSCYQCIVINFTSPMLQSELSDFSNIEIINSRNVPITEYFNNPILSEDGKTLSIFPIQSKIKTLVSDSSVYDITVVISSNLHENKKNPEPFEEYTHTYRINAQKDNSDPVFKDSDIVIERQLKNLFTDEEYKTVIDDTPFESWTDENDGFNTHHVADSIYITCKGYDEGSGVKALYIKEKMVKLANGTDNSDEYEGSENGTFIQTSENFYSSDTFEYTLKAERDGVVQLDFALLDYDNRKSDVKTYYVIRDTAIVNTIDINAQDCAAFNNDYFVAPNTNGKYEVNNKNPFKFVFYDDFYDGRYSYCKVTISYGSKNEEYKTLDILYTKTKEYSSTDKKFQLNPIVDSYIKLAAETDLGQKVEKSFLVPAATKVDPYTYTQSSKTLNFKLTSSEHYYVIQERDPEIEEYGELSKMEQKYGDNPTYEATLTSNKIYRIYKIVAQRFDENNRNGYYSCAYYPMEFKIDSSGKLTGLDPNYIITAWPEIQCSVDDPLPNTGVHTVRIKYIKKPDLSSKGYEFHIFCQYEENGNDAYIYPFSDDVFDLPSGRKYQIGFTWYDKYGRPAYSKTATYPEIDATHNNTAPDLSSVYMGGGDMTYTFGPNVLYFCSMNGKLPVGNTYTVKYYVEKAGSVNWNAPAYSEEKVRGLYEYTKNVTIKTQYFDVSSFPVDLENGLNIVYYKVIDSNGNYATKSGSVSALMDMNTATVDVSKIKYETKNDEYCFEFSLLDSPAGSNVAYLKDKKEWVNGLASNAYNGSKIEKGMTYKLAYDTTKNNFVKFIMYKSYNSTYNTYFKTVYLYPPFFANGGKINKANLIPGRNGDQIYIDQPALVRTLYSKTNWGDDSDLWATRGLENDLVLKDEDFTYKPKTEGIPKGNYYCTVVNFADGTSCMGEVKKMQ